MILSWSNDELIWFYIYENQWWIIIFFIRKKMCFKKIFTFIREKDIFTPKLLKDIIKPKYSLIC